MGKAMKISDIRKLTAAQFDEELLLTKKKQFEARVKNSTGQLKSTAEIGELRKHFARLLTVGKEKETK